MGVDVRSCLFDYGNDSVLSGADKTTRFGDRDAVVEINILRMIRTVKSRLVKLALTLGSVLTALLAGAASMKIG